jgi:hypothetical protein
MGVQMKIVCLSVLFPVDITVLFIVLPGIYLRENITAPNAKQLSLTVDKTCAAYFSSLLRNLKTMTEKIRKNK